MMYQRGDIVWLDFPFSDLSKTKYRPALIISNQEVNRSGDYILAQITSRNKKDGLSVPINDSDYLNSPLRDKSYIRVHKLFTLSESKIERKETSVSPDLMVYVVNKLNTVVSPDDRGRIIIAKTKT